MDIEKILIGLVLLSSIYNGWKADSAEKELKEIKEHTAYMKKVTDANATKERVYHDMNTKIEKDHNETINTLDSNDVIDFGG